MRNVFVEPTESDFVDIFDHEVCRFRSQKLSPSKLLENTAFLLSHVDDALKLFSNRSEENLTELRNANVPAASHVTGLQPRGALDGPPYSALPFSQLEHIQRIIAVYLCLHAYLCEYVLAGETIGEPLNEVTSPALERISAFASFGDIPPTGKVLVSNSCSFDISEYQLFGCKVEHQSGQHEKQYFLLTELQIVSVVPSHRKIGLGIVVFCGLIQDTELRCDPTDDCALIIVAYKPGDRSRLTVRRTMMEAGPAFSSSPSSSSSSPLPNVFPIINAKLRFCTSFQCSAFYKMATYRQEKIVASKQEKLKQMLSVSDKPIRPSVQAILSEGAPNQPRLHAPLTIAKPLRSTSSAPTTLLQKARAYSLSSAPSVNNHAPHDIPNSTASKTTGEMQAIAMVDLMRRHNTFRTTSPE
ncbi:unnamed protein product [Hydatigera taeniaeformis]|uniref:CLEC16A_C domain-containing protein n=1 Tax=Hydatigena taeniaeformis TaxID=6205 RepID=A0A0R3WTG7_HYDTA|nr:unnamed protein product [Hydatigera taeniaeformis]